MRESTGPDAFLLGPAVPSGLAASANRSHLRLSPGRLELVRSARRSRTFDVGGGSLHQARGRRSAELVISDRDGGPICTFDPVQWCVAPPPNETGALPPHAQRWREQLGKRIARALDVTWSADAPADARGATRLLPGAGTAARRHVVTMFA
ncbi:MAG: hypothetical protein GEU96_17995, partial [Propionibacteriales bacterium]|nr:hypothetical protein [Propionibacteriales bacterium]